MEKKHRTQVEKYNSLVKEIKRLEENGGLSNLSVTSYFLGSIANSLAIIADLMVSNGNEVAGDER